MRRFHEGATSHPTGDILHAGDLPNRIRVLERQRSRAAETARDVHALAAAREIPGADLNDVSASRLERGLHRSARACSERDHRDHRGDADHHTEHGERGPKAIAIERSQGDLRADIKESQHILKRLPT